MKIILLFTYSISAVLLLLLLKQTRSSLVIPASILFSILLLNYTVNQISDSFSFISNFINNSSLSSYHTTLLKVFGVSLLAETTSDICKDAGENSIASKVELLGKTELIIISIPLIEEVLQITKELIL